MKFYFFFLTIIILTIFSQSLSKKILRIRSKDAIAFDSDPENNSCLVGGFITEIFGVHKEYKKTMIESNKSSCMKAAQVEFMVKSNGLKIKQVDASKLTGDQLKCKAFVKNIPEDDFSLLTPEQNQFCANVLQKHDLGIIELVKLLFGVTKEFKNCVDKQTSTQDAVLGYCKTAVSILGSVIVNIIFPGASLIIGAAKITWYSWKIAKKLVDDAVDKLNKNRVLGKYLARICKVIIPGILRRRNKKLK